MDKKIGKIGMIVLMSWSFLRGAEPRLELRLTTMQGTPVQGEIQVGVPHLLEVIGHDLSALHEPEIAGLDQWYHESRGSYKTITTVNGRTRRVVQMTYYVRADKVGHYTVGPAQFVSSHGLLVSNELTVEAVAGRTVMERGKPLFVELGVDKNNVVIGEPVTVTITLYARSDAQVVECGIPVIAHRLFENRSVAQPSQGVRKIDGSSYQYAQWELQIIPADVGQLIIPAATIDCVTQSGMSNRNLLSRAFHRFGFGMQQQHVISNAVAIDVSPLPPGPGRVDAVGSFKDFSARLSHQRAKEGEGVVFTLQLLGQGDSALVKDLSVSLPEQVRFYSSKVAVEAADEPGMYKKSFEYIVQGLKPGEWTLPAQEFTFFDLNKRQYATLMTKPLALIVDPMPKAQGVATQTLIDVPTTITVAEPEGRLSLNSSGPWLARSQSLISWRLFWLLVWLPLLVLSMSWVQRLIERLKRSKFFLHRRAFAQIILGVKECEHVKDMGHLYEVFKKFVADITKAPHSLITVSTMEDFGRHVNLRAAEQQKWQIFLQEIASSRYAAEKSTYNVELIAQARQWISRFQEGV